jgi:2-methylcitrate dehydratase PrpD
MKDIFNYHSEQKHEIICTGGKCIKKINRVTIKNGKGVKEVIVKGPVGKAKRSTKRLSKKEVKSIKNLQFIPGLFRKM